MTPTWIVVAHRAGARFFELHDTKLQLVQEIAHEEGRLRNKDIDADRPGRAFDRPPGQGRHAFGTHESPHDHVAVTFARELAEILRRQRTQNSFERLVLVAEPGFLGMLRGALDHATASTVSDTLAKDLAQVTARELPEYLREIVLV